VTRHPRTLAAAAAALLLPGLAACGGGDGPAGGPGPIEPPRQGALRLELTPPGPAGGADFVLAVRLALPPEAPPLAAFAVEVAFDPARFQVLSSDGLGPGRVVNVAETTPGHLVATGAWLTGFHDGLLFQGRLRSTGPAPTASDFQLALTEAIDVQLRDVRPGSP
jgi:hypothetical protein